MRPEDVVPLLTKLGFEQLKLTKHEDKTSTFTYQGANIARLVKTLGAPTIAGGGKVKIFKIEGVGRLGLSVSNSVVRFIADYAIVKPESSTAHLGKIQLPDVLVQALQKAKVTNTLRVAWLEKTWEWANAEFFHNKMPKPAFLVSPKPPSGGFKRARGVYFSGRNYTAGKIYMADYVFNARAAFVFEIMLHEMCHQAVWTIDKVMDASEGGHGATWKKWMVHVGLDPRRYDPTEELEYQKTGVARQEETKLDHTLGKRKDDAWFARLIPMTSGFGQALVRYKGRAIVGEFVKTGPTYVMRYTDRQGRHMALTYKKRPTELYRVPPGPV